MLKRINKNLLKKKQFYCFSTQTYDLKVGDKIHDFELKKVEKIEDFNLTSYQLQHTKTKTNFLHFDSNDKNNCMAIVFRTIPNNDKGTPHILEHLTCCGGKIFPVRDPFFKMIKRSLNTYMNAWTGPDFTCYPFSSQNAKDFHNLMKVYFDITFDPLLAESDFQQEGWRFDLNNEQKLDYKGVVYNEMKGVYQTSDNIYYQNIFKHSLKNTVYEHNYGGDPQAITDLTYQELLQFYQKFYHPSNARIFSYGNQDFRKSLQYINDNYLSKYNYQAQNTNVEVLKEKQQKQTIYVKGPSEAAQLDQEKQIKMSFSFICNDVVQNVIESQGLSLLSYLLLNTPSSPLYQALLESGIASSYSPGTGFENSIRQGFFNIGVSGISKEQIQEVENIIFDCLDKVKEEGFDKEIIEGALHQIEINNKIQQQNFGINLLQYVMNQYNHDGEVNQLLKVSENLSILREKIFKEDYLQKLIKQYLTKENLRIQLIMEPDEQFHQKISQSENEKLQQLENKVNKQQITEQNKSLQEQQNLKENYECLPKLEISDIERDVIRTTFRQEKYKDVPIYFTNQNTNGLTFMRIQFDMEQVPLYIRQYISLFSLFITRIGTSQMNYKDFQKKLNLFTTNLSFGFESSNPFNFEENKNNKPNNYGLLSIACIDRNLDQMCELLQELLTIPDFKDMQNVTTILRNETNDISNQIIEQALNYGVSVSTASLRENFFIKEKLNSTRFLFSFTNNFLKKNNNSSLYLDDLNFHMQSIMQFMMRKNKVKFIVHGNEQNFDKVYQNITKIIDNLHYAFTAFKFKAEQAEIYDNPFQKQYINKYFALDSQVNYCIQSFEVPNFVNKDTPKLQLLGQLISDVVLHREIREKGGAYGSGCQFKDTTMNFFSYRDPNTLQTFEVYKNAIKSISEGQFDNQNIDESKLSLFSKIDQIVKPQDRGLVQVLENVSDEMRQQYRENIIDTNRDDLVRVCREYLLKQLNDNQFSKVVFGNQLNDLEEIKKAGFSVEEPIQGLEQAQENEQDQNQ